MTATQFASSRYQRSYDIRSALYALPIVAVAAFATPAFAQPYEPGYNNYETAAPFVAGAAVGTAVALGAYNGWYASWGAAGAMLPSTALGAAAVGGVAAIGTVALVDAAIQPCRGFHALFDLNHGRCVNGQYVGDGPRPVAYRQHGRRVLR